MKNFTTIAIMAESNHGKDFCSDWIVEAQGYTEKVAFSDHLKRLCNSVLEFGYNPLWGESKLRNVPMYVDWDRAEYRLNWLVDDWISQIKTLSIEERASYKSVVHSWLTAIRLLAYHSDNPEAISPRSVLQLLGTEYGRVFKNDIWTSFVTNYVIPEIKSGKDYRCHVGIIPKTSKGTTNGVIISDSRFCDELTSIQAMGGYMIKVIRNSKVDKTNEALQHGVANHMSEMALKNIPDDAFDLILHLDEGKDKVYSRLQEVFDNREFEIRRKEGKTPWKP